MIFIILLLVVFYITIGSSLGGLYYYLIYKESEGYCDLEDMGYLPVWITALWVIIAPLAFAIYYAKKKAESEDEKQ